MKKYMNPELIVMQESDEDVLTASMITVVPGEGSGMEVDW